MRLGPIYQSVGQPPALARLRAGGAVAAAVPIVDTVPLYSENFNRTDGTRLVADLGWSAFSANVATDEKNNLQCIGNELRARTSGYLSDGNTSGKYLITPGSIGGADQFIEWTVGSTVPSLGIGHLNASDNWNNVRFDYSTSTATIFKFSKDVANTITQIGSSVTSNTTRRAPGGLTGAMRLVRVGDRIKLVSLSGTAYMFRNGVPLGPTTGFSLSGVTLGNYAGLNTANNSYTNIDNFKAGVATGVLVVTSPTQRSYPRIQGLGGYANGAADVTFSGSYVGLAPTNFHWTLEDWEGGATVKAWDWVTSFTVNTVAKTWTATVRIPCGLNGRFPYSVGFRASNDTSITGYCTLPIRVTVTGLAIGQSNMQQITLVNSSGVTDHPGGLNYTGTYPSTTAVSIVMNSNWETNNTETTGVLDANVGALTNLLSLALNLPVSITNVAIGAHGANALDPDLGNSDGTWIRTHMAAAGGAFDFIIVSQGENEINAANTDAALLWKSQWVTNLAHYRAYSGQPAGTVIPAFFAITGRYDNTTYTSNVYGAPPYDSAVIVRKAQAEIASEQPNCYVAAHPIGVALAAGSQVHFSQNDQLGYRKYADRFGLTLAKFYGATAFDGRGPRATGTATRSGAVITIPITLNGADSLTSTNGTGTGLTGFEVSASSTFSTLLAQSSAVISGNNVVITLASNPGAPVYVRFYVGHMPPDTNVVVGNYTSATTYFTGTIEMEPVAVPILTAT